MSDKSHFYIRYFKNTMGVVITLFPCFFKDGGHDCRQIKSCLWVMGDGVDCLQPMALRL